MLIAVTNNISGERSTIASDELLVSAQQVFIDGFNFLAGRRESWLILLCLAELFKDLFRGQVDIRLLAKLL